MGPHQAPVARVHCLFTAKWEPPASGVPLSFGCPQHSFRHTSLQHQSLHTTLEDAPRVSEFRLTILEAGRASIVLHLNLQSCRHVPVDSCQGENLLSTADLAMSKAVLHVQARRESRVRSVKPWLQIGLSSFWNIFVTKVCMCSLCTPLSAPTWRLFHFIGSFIIVQQIHHGRCVLFRKLRLE